MAELRPDIEDFARRDLTLLGKTKPVLATGSVGPAVIIVHEVYGFTPTLARFCRWVRDAGFRVYAPVLFGSVDASNPERIQPSRLLGLCISREFHLFAAGKSSQVVEWLKELARLAHRECGKLGVGAVGMCLTGNFALAMAVEPDVLAQPGLPSHKPAAIDVSTSDLATVRNRIEKEGLLVRRRRQVLPRRAVRNAAPGAGQGFRRHHSSGRRRQSERAEAATFSPPNSLMGRVSRPVRPSMK